MDYVLWLASWYPNELAPYDGDFIQRQARAVAGFQRVVVFHFRKDENALITKNIKIVSSSSKNLEELVVFYHPKRTGIRFLDRLLSSVKYKKAYASVLENYFKKYGKPSLVHVHVAFKAGLQALYIKKNFRIPYIVTEHWTGYHKEAKFNINTAGYIHKNSTERILKNALLLLPVSKNLGELVNMLVQIPFKVVPNVVNTEFFYYKPVQINKFRFIHVSSLNYHKNPEEIIESIYQLKGETANFEFIFIGPYSKHLKNLSDSFELTNKFIFFKSTIPYQEVAKEMQQSSALVLFSRVENLPCVVLEALCCGLPVISSNVGGIAEVINQNNGILVEPGNKKQLKEAMKKMILDYDTFNRDFIAESAADKFDYATVGEQIADTYNSLVDRNL
jgi:glycosyltransferase involved in cell wall biosynthesis